MAYRTTPRQATNEMLFSLAYDFEVLIPLEVRLSTIQTEAYNNDHNDEVLAQDLDLTEERRKMHLYEWPVIRNSSPKNKQEIFSWRPRFEKYCWKYQRPSRREARLKLGAFVEYH